MIPYTQNTKAAQCNPRSPSREGELALGGAVTGKAREGSWNAGHGHGQYLELNSVCRNPLSWMLIM